MYVCTYVLDLKPSMPLRADLNIGEIAIKPSEVIDRLRSDWRYLNIGEDTGREVVRPWPLFASRATAAETSARKLALAAATATLTPSAPALRARNSAAVTEPEETGFPSATFPRDTCSQYFYCQLLVLALGVLSYLLAADVFCPKEFHARARAP